MMMNCHKEWKVRIKLSFASLFSQSLQIIELAEVEKKVLLSIQSKICTTVPLADRQKKKR